jgi:hypothetical protein
MDGDGLRWDFATFSRLLLAIYIAGKTCSDFNDGRFMKPVALRF